MCEPADWLVKFRNELISTNTRTVQMVSRICGTYTDKPTLNLWTPQENYDTLAEGLESDERNTPPLNVVDDLHIMKFHHSRATPLFTRPQVEQRSVVNARKNFMPEPHLHGERNVRQAYLR